MTEDVLLPFDLPAVRRKKVIADFEGGLISSDGGLVLLREAERRLGLAETAAVTVLSASTTAMNLIRSQRLSNMSPLLVSSTAGRVLLRIPCERLRPCFLVLPGMAKPGRYPGGRVLPVHRPRRRPRSGASMRSA